MPDETVPAVVQLHFDHYMKLLDLFETRQTNAFNYAIGVYAGAGAAAVIFSKTDILVRLIYGSGKPEPTPDLVVIGAAVLVYAVAVPLVLLPLFYLYIDVSIYCAALSAGSFLFQKEFGSRLELSDPGLRAFDWLSSIHEDISPHFNRRAMLFLYAPTFGFLLALYETWLSCRQHHLKLGAVVVGSAIISSVCLSYTICGVWRNKKVRAKSIDVKNSRIS